MLPSYGPLIILDEVRVIPKLQLSGAIFLVYCGQLSSKMCQLYSPKDATFFLASRGGLQIYDHIRFCCTRILHTWIILNHNTRFCFHFSKKKKKVHQSLGYTQVMLSRRRWLWCEDAELATLLMDGVIYTKLILCCLLPHHCNRGTLLCHNGRVASCSLIIFYVILIVSEVLFYAMTVVLLVGHFCVTVIILAVLLNVMMVVL